MFAVVPEFVSPPPLASSLSAFHAEASFERAMLLDGPMAPAVPSPSVDAGRFVRHHKLGKTGLYVTIAGIGVTFVAGTALFVGALNCVNNSANTCNLAGPVALVFIGGLTTLTGSVLMFVGELEAAYDARRIGLSVSPTVGWIGVGLLAGAEVLSLTVGSTTSSSSNTSGNASGALGYVGSALGLAGLICGAVQLGEDGHAGRAHGLIARVVPTPNGMMVAGAF